MKKFFLLSVAAILICSMSHATIRRVGYFGPAVSGVDYSTFQLAHNAATTGDTIMMHPGSSFGSATMTKQLVVIGPGYFLSQNVGLQANPLGMDSTSAQPITISNASANGSSFLGCTFTNNSISITGTGVSNISFIRCWFNGVSGNPSLKFSQNINSFVFQQCAFKGDIIQPENSTSVATNMAFLNCLIYSIPNTSFNFPFYFYSALPHSGLIQNCVFNQGQNTTMLINLNGSWQVTNTISNANAFTGAGITYQNCIGTSTQFPAGNGNLQNQSWANIFTLTGSTDAQYTLKAGSPAIGAGIGGTNCGIFGGSTPYKLSGIPSVPTLYSISSPQGNTPTLNTVQINISTRSNN